MIFYKLRHIPTGLFFKPSKYGSKSNLSKNGKVYSTKPSLKYVSNGYHHPLKQKWPKANYEYRKYVEGDWEIVEIKVTE
jgi:hypothetical protein